MKKGKIVASGDRLTEPLPKKNPLPRPSNLAVTMETPQTQTSTFPQTNQKNEHLLHWLNSFPHTLPNPSSIPLTEYLHWLLECHKSQQLPLSLQQAHWAEVLDLEYPPKPEVDRLTYLETSLEVEKDSEEDHRTVEDLLMPDNPQMETPLIQLMQDLEEGEIPQIPEEGEILLTEDFLTNY
jgi:hypothetical protein